MPDRHGGASQDQQTRHVDGPEVRGRQEMRDTLMHSEMSDSGIPAAGGGPYDPAPGADGTATLPVLLTPPSGHRDGGEAAAGPGRAPTSPLPDGRSRTGTVVAGDYLVGVNAPDGSTVEIIPPAAHPAAEALRPRPSGAAADAPARSARTAAQSGVLRPSTTAPLLEREDELERLRTLLTQGRSVRVTGPPGSGRSMLLDAVASAVSALAPAGVVRLSGRRRTAADVLQDLFAATAPAEVRGGADGRPRFRPDREQLVELLRRVGAVVVVDDLEFGGDALEEMLRAAPECAFLVSAAPAVPAPLPESRMAELVLPGLSREAGLRLLAQRAGRSLDEAERSWGVDLWFESEGLPLRFVQAATLLRHRDAALAAIAAGKPAPEWRGGTARPGVDLLQRPELPAPAPERPAGPPALLPARRGASGPGGGRGQDTGAGRPGDRTGPTATDPVGTVPLPSVAESAAPAVRVARGLSPAAQRLLRLAVALDGEIPTAPHLPALLDDDQPESALRELLAAGLAAPAGNRHRLAHGVREPLAEEWPDTAAGRDAAQHFAWWTGHASVTPELIAAEADVLLAVMRADRDAGRHESVVLLARAAAPSFALALDWHAWERALRFGLEAARATGAVAEEAWFDHELGVLSLCLGSYDRARAELEASVALRGALGDVRGTRIGRRALDLLAAVSARRALAPGAAAGPGGSARTRGLRRIAVLRKPADGPLLSRRNVAAAASGAILLGALASAVALGTGGAPAAQGGAGPDVGSSPSTGAPAQSPDASASPAATTRGTPSGSATSRSAGPTARSRATGAAGGTPAGGATTAGAGATTGGTGGSGGAPSPTGATTRKPSPSPTGSSSSPAPTSAKPTSTATATSSSSSSPSATGTAAAGGGSTTTAAAPASGAGASSATATPGLA